MSIFRKDMPPPATVIEIAPTYLGQSYGAQPDVARNYLPRDAGYMPLDKSEGLKRYPINL